MIKNRILIVDDEAPIREILENIVSKEGLISSSYENGKLALEALTAHHDDVMLVITDIKMPEMDGIQLIREAKKLFPDLPFVIASGYGTKDNIITALKLGALDYLEKPFQVKDIANTIQRIKRAVYASRQTTELYHYLEEKRIIFKIGNDLHLVPSLVEELVSEIQRGRRGSLPFDLTGIRMALHEAVINAIEHGNLELSSMLKEEPNYLEILSQRAAELPYAKRQVVVSTTIKSSSFSCTITDEGPGFNWQSLPDPRNPDNLFKPHGRGIILIANYFDQLTFSEQGNSISMEKCLV
ncbi:MAG: response regulator [Deltaproteobacteria bacterium]|nr:response regulator [Candidatus Anaeroferrophillus wilburensis]MBN2889450.1 response regulator [Deltaproteobacteria bacterium]